VKGERFQPDFVVCIARPNGWFDREELVMSEMMHLQHLEWQALLVLYRHRANPSVPLRYVGFKNTVLTLIRHHPPLAEWVGKPSDNQLHITDEGIALYKGMDTENKGG
jgi:hypothetical protein